MLTRILTLTLLLALTAVLLVPQFGRLRREHRVKQTLLTVQRALQDYHVAEEAYPPNPMTGAQLINLLLRTGHLAQPPLNPRTGKPYAPDTETEATDRLRYTTDEFAETYTLRALNPRGEETFLLLDSTEHQSLE